VRAINRVADRMLGALVPKVTADAQCAIYQWVQECYCRNNYVYDQSCETQYSCATVCGPCNRTNIEC